MASKIFCDVCKKQTNNPERFVFENKREICEECSKAAKNFVTLMMMNPKFDSFLEEFLAKVYKKLSETKQ